MVIPCLVAIPDKVSPLFTVYVAAPDADPADVVLLEEAVADDEVLLDDDTPPR